MREAFKEWAVICKALAAGRQAIIVRKGGVAESAGIFTPDHTRFWLYPTYAHQQRDGIKPEAGPLLEEAERERPPAGVLRLSHFVEVSGVFQVHKLFGALVLDHLHLWSEGTIRKRFDYRQPGLFVLPARVYQVPQTIELVDKPEYEGCKTWVEFDRDLPTDGAVPVLDDRRFADVLESLHRLLNPTAWA